MSSMKWYGIASDRPALVTNSMNAFRLPLSRLTPSPSASGLASTGLSCSTCPIPLPFELPPSSRSRAELMLHPFRGRMPPQDFLPHQGQVPLHGLAPALDQSGRGHG